MYLQRAQSWSLHKSWWSALLEAAFCLLLCFGALGGVSSAVGSGSDERRAFFGVGFCCVEVKLASQENKSPMGQCQGAPKMRGRRN